MAQSILVAMATADGDWAFTVDSTATLNALKVLEQAGADEAEYWGGWKTSEDNDEMNICEHLNVHITNEQVQQAWKKVTDEGADIDWAFEELLFPSSN
jgi:hypothetical protein